MAGGPGHFYLSRLKNLIVNHISASIYFKDCPVRHFSGFLDIYGVHDPCVERFSLSNNFSLTE